MLMPLDGLRWTLLYTSGAVCLLNCRPIKQPHFHVMKPSWAFLRMVPRSASGGASSRDPAPGCPGTVRPAAVPVTGARSPRGLASAVVPCAAGCRLTRTGPFSAANKSSIMFLTRRAGRTNYICRPTPARNDTPGVFHRVELMALFRWEGRGRLRWAGRSDGYPRTVCPQLTPLFVRLRYF